jgi:non-lysosomal glucosylceramidase
MEDSSLSHWPILRVYDQSHCSRIALPIGGIGTGTVSLGGRGNFQDWEIVNRPAKGFTPNNAFFVLRTVIGSDQPVVRALEGALSFELYEGWSGSPVANAGLPRFREYSFESAYPFGRVRLSDPDVPVDVCLEAFNPLIPGDADLSGIPIAVIRFILANKDSQVVSASICGNLQNFIGEDGSSGAPKCNRNSVKKNTGLHGIFLSSDGINPEAEQWGSIALSTTSNGDATFRSGWAEFSWCD